jgi:sortase A
MDLHLDERRGPHPPGACRITAGRWPGRRLGWPEVVLAAAGIALLVAWAAQGWSSQRFQASAGERLDRALAATQALPSRPAAVVGGEGALARLEIARLGLVAMVDEGTTPRVLERAVGHLESTARPGEAGNCVLAGHRDTFFRRLGGIRVGDVVRLTSLDGQWEYRVSAREVVSPRRTDLLRDTASPTLTLVTCYPLRWIGPAPMRLVVRAERVGL